MTPAAPLRAYLDHASTSPLRAAARDATVEWLSAADPARVHTEGRMARFALEDARAQVAALFGVRPRQVIFTSGATEAVNSAVYGALVGRPAPRVVLSDVEHSCVREASERWAASIIPVPVASDGTISAAGVTDALERSAGERRGDPAESAGERGGSGVGLVHCQLANHEVGTIQPVADVAETCKRHGALLHVDAAAAAGHIGIDFEALGADLMSVSAHKFGGPKGIGALIVRRGLRIEPYLLGGAQERARRGGLENLPAAMGFGAAAAELCEDGSLDTEAAAATALTDKIRASVAAIPGVEIYGPDDPARRLPCLVCLGIAGVEAEPVLIGLDQAGVAAHSGSSCSSEALEPSPVLAAMGVDADRSLRLSVGWSTTTTEIEMATSALPRIIERLRSLSAAGG